MFVPHYFLLVVTILIVMVVTNFIKNVGKLINVLIKKPLMNVK